MRGEEVWELREQVWWGGGAARAAEGAGCGVGGGQELREQLGGWAGAEGEGEEGQRAGQGHEAFRPRIPAHTPLCLTRPHSSSRQVPRAPRPPQTPHTMLLGSCLEPTCHHLPHLPPPPPPAPCFQAEQHAQEVARLMRQLEGHPSCELEQVQGVCVCGGGGWTDGRMGAQGGPRYGVLCVGGDKVEGRAERQA